MKIASIGMQVRGGAGLSSLKLHDEFLRQGHDARFYVGKSTLHPSRVQLIPNSKKHRGDWWRLGTLPVEFKVDNIVTSGFSGKSDEYLDGVYEWADVILLRWITATVSDWQIAQWSRGTKPLVWCLSDMAPFTGGCHYSRGCAQYEVDCGDCAMVAEPFRTTPKQTLRRRTLLWRDITVVSPSRWLADCAARSPVFANKDVHVIRTGVELDVFKPIGKEEARSRFGLAQDKITLFFGANSASEERKGFHLLIESLKHLRRMGFRKNDIQVLVIGLPGKLISDELFEHHHLGRIDDRARLAAAYSAADLTVLPYQEDNLPNVALESLACGTPVCAFEIGGLLDVIEPGLNGALAIPFDPHDFAHQMVCTLARAPSTRTIRAWAEKNLSVGTQAEQYLKLFDELVHERDACRRSSRPIVGFKRPSLS